ncbi:hypothetical protein [Methanosphaera sp.]|mgnify:CR=1 FL=1|uniref:hypothetical protein n=1 Tax=Methanosphaera sp. TaxID=2666342 RepID=UPI0025CBFEBE|nr:hypothetical protein [Methanosphaera sp.]MEE1117469.1 hypothetical protein [Methanosphaera sp.]MEE3324110.1 hypothetical protein [Methanosphaera sp.]MEE3419345.1 hypothetical protein [Methanosphaera sp.]
MADNALGRGLDALIKKPSKPKKAEKKEVKDKKPKIETNTSFSLSDDKIEQIKEEVGKNPRISLWSAKSAACLRYLKKTTPEFSISNEASLILEEAIKEKYPEIWKLFEE